MVHISDPLGGQSHLEGGIFHLCQNSITLHTVKNVIFMLYFAAFFSFASLTCLLCLI